MVENDSKWDTHSITPLNKDVEFKVIAESERGMMIIEQENSIGINFHISEKYEFTQFILQRFIRNAIQIIYENSSNKKIKQIHKKKFDLNIGVVNRGNEDLIKPQLNFFKSNKDKNEMTKLKESQMFTSVEYANRLAKHTGVGISNRKAIYVKYNSMEASHINRHSSENHSKKLPVSNEKFNKDIERVNLFKVNSELQNKWNSKCLDIPEDTIVKVYRKQNQTNYENFVEKENQDTKENLFSWSENNQEIKNMNENQMIDFYIMRRRELAYKMGVEDSLRKAKRDENINSLSDYISTRPMTSISVNSNKISKFNTRMNSVKSTVSNTIDRKLNSNDREFPKVISSVSSINSPNQSAVRLNLNQDKVLGNNKDSGINDKKILDSKQCKYYQILTDPTDRKNIFQFFYPYVNASLIPEEKEVHIKGTLVEKIHSTREINHIKQFKNRFYNNYNKLYRKYESDLDYFATKSIMCTDDYIFPETLRRKEEIENKKFWKGPDFKRVFPVQKDLKKGSELVDYSKDFSNTAYEGCNLANYKYREVKKDKWISQKSFKFKY